GGSGKASQKGAGGPRTAARRRVPAEKVARPPATAGPHRAEAASLTVLIAIAGLGFLILIHEAGHFFTALATGMRPRRFYVGFPPALVKWKRKGVEYGIGAIPLGGYVKIP